MNDTELLAKLEEKLSYLEKEVRDIKIAIVGLKQKLGLLDERSVNESI